MFLPEASFISSTIASSARSLVLPGQGWWLKSSFAAGMGEVRREGWFNLELKMENPCPIAVTKAFNSSSPRLLSGRLHAMAVET